eukprot:TRINITY_DN6898_c0_g1_i1.p1 TRINITY_DN6898_c0_g1~~TRINITY_DN6898_c0_g1_i1.p1  ORF type:complete len:109 (-),score=29.24 TRINITY_DN6898_c0_g1_i1:310-636(-)
MDADLSAIVNPPQGPTPYDNRPMEELMQILAQREALNRKLEAELEALRRPSDLERRINALELGVSLAAPGAVHEHANGDAREHAKQVHQFVQAIRDDHQDKHGHAHHH